MSKPLDQIIEVITSFLKDRYPRDMARKDDPEVETMLLLASLEAKGFAVIEQGRTAPFIAMAPGSHVTWSRGIPHPQQPYTPEPRKEES